MPKKVKKNRFYYNRDFLGSPDGRSIRILSEYYGPLQRLRRNHIRDTIVFFGSARIQSREICLRQLNLAKKSKSAISLGGGAFLNKKIRKEILENHISFWLYWDTKTLINRIINSQKRPIALNASKNELINLIKKRSIVYSKAMYKINCENLTKNEVVKDILKIYEAH